MGFQNFTKNVSVRDVAGNIDRVANAKSARDNSIENLLKHLPGEATALYLAGLDAVGKNASVENLIIIALVALGVMLLLRILSKSSPPLLSLRPSPL